MSQLNIKLILLALLFSCLTVLITACGTAPRKPVEDPYLSWQDRQQSLKQLRHWRISGRIGIKALNNSGSSGTAKLFWEQNDNTFLLKITGPLGRHLVRLENTNELVTLTNSKGLQFTGTDAESLIWQHTGWRLPIKKMQYWVLGLAEKQQVDELLLDEFGRLKSFTVPDWDINYQRYEMFGQHDLPTKMQLDNPQLKLKLVLTKWTFFN